MSAALTGLAGVGLLSASPSVATPVQNMTKVYDQVVYGDYSMIGNSVVDCVTNANGNTSTECTNYLTGASSQVNDTIYWTQYQANSALGGINSSMATVAVPAGASIVKAQLYWGGTTGYMGPDLQTGCAAGATNTKPSGSPSTMTPYVSVNGGARAVVPVANYNVDAAAVLTAATLPQYYSANNDITSLFSGLGSTGGTVNVTVGNIYTPSGLGCFGGWSLALVWDFGTYLGTSASTGREVMLYDGHVRISSGVEQTVSFSGFTASDAGIRLATSAFEGDRAISGDQLFYSTGTATPTTALTNPVTGSAANYFASVANGQATQPAGGSTAANGAIDVTQQQVSTPSGMTQFNLRATSSQDSYLFNTAMFSVPVGAIELKKSGPGGAANQVVAVGERPQFTITVTNTGSATLRNIRVTDPQAPYCDSATGQTTPATSTLPTSLSPGQSYSYTCFGPPITAAGETFVNTASVTSTSASGDTAGTGVTSVTVLKPNLAVDKSASVATVDNSGSVTYTYSVTNNNTAQFSSEPLKTVRVTDDKCAPVSYVSGDSNGDGVIQAGETWLYRCTSTVPAAGDTSKVVTNTATATGVTTREQDPATGSLTNRTVTTTDTASVTVLKPNLNLTKSVGASTGPSANGTYTTQYTISVINSGDGTGTYSALTDRPAFAANLIPTGATWSGQQAGSATGAGPYILTSGTSSIAANTTHTYTLTVTWRYSSNAPASACGGTGTGLYNSVTMTGEQGSTADNAACASAPAAPAPGISLLKSASAITDIDGNGPDAGDTITYSFAVTNTGNVNLSSVVVNDPKLGLTNFACATGPVAPGASVACTATRLYTITQPDADAGGVSNSATASATPPSLPAVTSAASTTTTAITAAPALTMAKAAGTPVDVNGNGVTDPGDTIAYTFTVTNTGNTTLATVRITDAKLGLTSWSCVANLAPGSEATCTAPAYTVTAGDQSAGSVVNSATATGTAPGGASATTPASTATVAVASATSIDVSKSVLAAPTAINPATGQFVISYNVTVRNSGQTPGSYGPLLDQPQFASTIQVVSADWSGHTTGSATGSGPFTLSPAATPIAGGATHTYLVRVFGRFTSSAPASTCGGPSTALYNAVSATGENATTANNATCAPAPPPTAPSLSLTKTAGVIDDLDHSESATAGDAITYAFTVANTGNVTVSSPTVSDPLLAGQGSVITCDKSTLLPGESTSCTASAPYTLTQGDVDAGAVSNTASATATPVDGTLSPVTSSTTTPVAAGPYITLD